VLLGLCKVLEALIDAEENCMLKIKIFNRINEKNICMEVFGGFQLVDIHASVCINRQIDAYIYLNLVSYTAPASNLVARRLMLVI